MGDSFDSGANEFDPVGFYRFAGYAAAVLATFVGYFHVHLWLELAGVSNMNTLSGSIGVLMLTALAPLTVLVVGRGLRDSAYARLERDQTALRDMLHRRGHMELSTREVVNRMIGVYGEAQGVSSMYGWIVTGVLALTILIAARIFDTMAVKVAITDRQAQLLTLFLVLSSFSLWSLIWPQTSRADQLDPSDAIASAIGR
jgi:hypothetical protein